MASWEQDGAYGWMENDAFWKVRENETTPVGPSAAELLVLRERAAAAASYFKRVAGEAATRPYNLQRTEAAATAEAAMLEAVGDVAAYSALLPDGPAPQE